MNATNLSGRGKKALARDSNQSPCDYMCSALTNRAILSQLGAGRIVLSLLPLQNLFCVVFSWALFLWEITTKNFYRTKLSSSEFLRESKPCKLAISVHALCLICSYKGAHWSPSGQIMSARNHVGLRLTTTPRKHMHFRNVWYLGYCFVRTVSCLFVCESERHDIFQR